MEAKQGGEGPLGARTARAGQPLTPRHVHGRDTARGSQSRLHAHYGLVDTQQGRILPSSEVSRQRENAQGPDPGAMRWTDPGLLDAQLCTQPCLPVRLTSHLCKADPTPPHPGHPAGCPQPHPPHGTLLASTVYLPD